MSVTMAQACEVLAAQPFSVLLGTRLTDFGPDGVTLELTARPDLRQQHGYLHGGVVSYLIDNAITFAAGAALVPSRRGPPRRAPRGRRRRGVRSRH